MTETYETPSELMISFDDGLVMIASSALAGFDDSTFAELFADYLFRTEPEAQATEMTQLNMFYGLAAGFGDDPVSGSADISVEGVDALHAAIRDDLSRNFSVLVTETLTFVTLAEDGSPISDYSGTDVGSEALLNRVLETASGYGLDLSEDILVSHYDQQLPIHVHRVFDPEASRSFHAVMAGAQLDPDVGLG